MIYFVPGLHVFTQAWSSSSCFLPVGRFPVCLSVFVTTVFFVLDFPKQIQVGRGETKRPAQGSRLKGKADKTGLFENNQLHKQPQRRP